MPIGRCVDGKRVYCSGRVCVRTTWSATARSFRLSVLDVVRRSSNAASLSMWRVAMRIPFACPMTSRASSAVRRPSAFARSCSCSCAPASASAAWAAKTVPKARAVSLERARAIAVKIERAEGVFGGEQAEREHAVNADVDGSRGERRPARAVIAKIM